MSAVKKKSNSKKKADESTALAVSIKAEMTRVREAFAAGPLFREPPAEQATPVAVAAWAVLDELEGVIKDRKEAYRQCLLEHAKANGKPTFIKSGKEKGKPSGGQEVMVDSSKVTREFRQDKLPQDTADFRLMLATKNIALSELFDEIKVLQMNPSRLDYLIDSGKLSEEEVNEYRKTAYALKVKQSEIIEEFLEDMTSQLLGTIPANRRLKSM